MSFIRTPLRYPGGKSCLAGYFRLLYKANEIEGGHYAEAYCGGAGVAIELLLQEIVRTIHINDADKMVAAFWRSVVERPKELCDRIDDAKLSVREWDRQKDVLRRRDDRRVSDLTLGFSMFYLNRTNRSGIMRGGIIGGRSQRGEWKINARFNKSELIERILRIASYSDRINVYELDAIDFIMKTSKKIKDKGLIYLDPPYFRKGHYLYMNYYKPNDHALVADKVQGLSTPWVVSYDDAKPISKLYRGFRKVSYSLNYSASKREHGSEVMFFSDGLDLPRRKSPVSIGRFAKG
jgi:DNA adenine methylase